MDFASLRAAALRDGVDEEAVTVDTRALIDKVLARYSGEWTTLRELIQNAADAQATTVSIKWETIPSTTVPLPSNPSPSDQLKHVVTHHTLRRLVVHNNGQPFAAADWARLKRIAEGNPDETKIGAFGVGFYSVFADCEEPFVSSGSQAMAFYWKANSLFTKRSQLPADKVTPYTAFVLDYRNHTTPVPDLLSVSQFLATSLTFVTLQNMECWIDGHRVISLQKKSSPDRELELPKELDTRTKEGLMRIAAVHRTTTQIDASYLSVVGFKRRKDASSSKTSEQTGAGENASLRSFFARLTSSTSHGGHKSKRSRNESSLHLSKSTEDATKLNSSSIFLHAVSASIHTAVPASFASELERATKKLPPKSTRLTVLTASFDEPQAVNASPDNQPLADPIDVFATVLPGRKQGGRIFIGFPTMQTTGAGLHLSAPSIIPTVEREAVDLNARWVRSWNVEMLRAAGTISRLAFASEMADLGLRLRTSVAPGAKMPKEAIAKFLPTALRILDAFSFRDSTPNAQVGQILEEAFWMCFKKASIEMFSNRGVLQSNQIRLASEDMAAFIEGIPVVPKEAETSRFVTKLMDFGLLSNITVTDIKQEFESKALSRPQAIKFIAWAAKQSLSGELDPGSRSALLDVAVTAAGEETGQGVIIALGSITHFQNVAKIPAHFPVPPTTIPFAFTATCSAAELRALGWETLEIVPWLRYLIETAQSRLEEGSITRSPRFAVQVLTVLSKNWDLVSNRDRETITPLLNDCTVIPTKLGMRRPREAFFPTVKLFDDLPVIQGCEKVKEKFLLVLGVRKTVDLDTIFTRLLNTSGEPNQKRWSHVELIRYLASVQSDIPADDLKKLRQSRICPAEAGPQAAEPSSKGTETLFPVSELFEPKDSLRALGLPILQWPGPAGGYRPTSPEGRFLCSLGIRSHPSVPELVEMMASEKGSLRTSAMTYFIANHHTHGYAAFELRDTRKAILPIEGSEQLAMPSACFTNPRAAVLGFSILRGNLLAHANKFGVATDPPITDCVTRLLAKPPKDAASAAILFGYLASRISEIRGPSLQRLCEAVIVPVSGTSIWRQTASSKGPTYITPSKAYLGTSVTYGEIFDFVDFGQEANSFLFHCGAKSEPTKLEVAHMVCTEPTRLLGVLQNPDKYLELLKSLAEVSSLLQRDKDLWRKMKASPCLLAYKEVNSSNLTPLTDVDEDQAPVKQFQLASAHHIVVLDDIISYRLFKDNLLGAPEEDVLESFYLQLGAQRLSDLVQEDVRIGSKVSDPKHAERLRKHVLERSKIFLYEYASYRRDSIKHDTKWLEKHLRIELVRSVALRRTLKDHRRSHTEKRSVAGAREQGTWFLYVAKDCEPDMYQLGQAICQMLLHRPNQQAYLFFEPFLTLDLLGLRARGYNVDRILRAKAAQARIAEEQRLKALEDEQRRIYESEKKCAEQSKPSAPADASVIDRQATKDASTPSMPGAWDPAPDQISSGGGVERKSDSKWGRGVLSHLSRRLGLEPNDIDRQTKAQKQLEPLLHGPSSSNTDLTARGHRPKTRLQDGDERVTSPAVVHQNLLNAINATRAHGSNSVFSQPPVKEVKEQASYCDRGVVNDMMLAAEASNGVKVFLSKEVSADPGGFLSANTAAINDFAALLVEVGSIYSLAPSVLHVFFDKSGNAIAFNVGGSIFCNLRFFLQLHGQQDGGPRTAAATADAAAWWWVVIAHELAHNLVTLHSAEHTYYTWVSSFTRERESVESEMVMLTSRRESFIQQYMGSLIAKTAQWKNAGAAAAVPPASTARPALPHAESQNQARLVLPPPTPPPPPPYSRS